MNIRLLRQTSEFKPVGVAFTIFSLLNLATFGIITLWPNMTETLWLSADRPWGILTSVFVHKDSSHLIGNLEFFLIWSLLFLLINWHFNKETRQMYAKVFLWLIFLSAFVTNTAEFIVRWLPSGVTNVGSWGASGIVYAAAGMCMASALTVLAISLTGLTQLGDLKLKIGRLSFGVLVATLLTLYVVQDPRTFLNVAPNVNVYAHGYSFLIAFFTGLVLFLIWSYRKMRRGNSIFAPPRVSSR